MGLSMYAIDVEWHRPLSNGIAHPSEARQKRQRLNWYLLFAIVYILSVAYYPWRVCHPPGRVSR